MIVFRALIGYFVFLVVSWPRVPCQNSATRMNGPEWRDNGFLPNSPSLAESSGQPRGEIDHQWERMSIEIWVMNEGWWMMNDHYDYGIRIDISRFCCSLEFLILLMLLPTNAEGSIGPAWHISDWSNETEQSIDTGNGTETWKWILN